MKLKKLVLKFSVFLFILLFVGLLLSYLLIKTDDNIFITSDLYVDGEKNRTAYVYVNNVLIHKEKIPFTTGITYYKNQHHWIVVRSDGCIPAKHLVLIDNESSGDSYEHMVSIERIPSWYKTISFIYEDIFIGGADGKKATVLVNGEIVEEGIVPFKAESIRLFNGKNNILIVKSPGYISYKEKIKFNSAYDAKFNDYIILKKMDNQNR